MDVDYDFVTYTRYIQITASGHYCWLPRQPVPTAREPLRTFIYISTQAVVKDKMAERSVRPKLCAFSSLHELPAVTVSVVG